MSDFNEPENLFKLSGINWDEVPLPGEWPKRKPPKSEGPRVTPNEQFQKLVDAMRGQTGFKTKGDTHFSCKCPAHDGKKIDSLSVDLKGEKVLIHCFSGCEPEAILKAIGLTWSTLGGSDSPEKEKVFNTGGFKASAGPIPTEYLYTDGTNAVLKVCRSGDGKAKKIWQCVPDGNGGWRTKTKDDVISKLAPYMFQGIKGLPPETTILWVEGEKDVHNLGKLGLPATTTAQGSQSPGKTNADLIREMVKGKDIILVPDSDGPGEQYANFIGEVCKSAGSKVWVIELPPEINGKPVNDCTDAIEAGWDSANFRLFDPVTFDDWQESDDHLDGVHQSMEPFPLEVFPPEMARFIENAAEILMLDPASIAVPMLGIAAGAIGTKRWLNVNGAWPIYSCIWSVLAVDSGGNKSAGIKLVQKPIWEVNSARMKVYSEAYERFQQAKAQYESLPPKERREVEKPEPPPAPRQCLIGDTTIESVATVLANNPEGTTLVRDELSTWLGGFERYSSGNNMTHWLGFHDGSPETINRVKFGVAPVILERPLVSISGAIQPEVAGKLLNSAAWSCGLVPRMPVASPPKKVRVLRESVQGIPGEAIYKGVIQWLLDSMPMENPASGEFQQYVRLDMTDEAFWAFKADHDARSIREHSARGGRASVISKLLGFPAKWGMIHHLLSAALKQDVEASYKMVDKPSIEAGIKLANWFETETARVFGLFAQAASTADDGPIWNYLEACQTGFKAKDLRQKFRRRFPKIADGEEWIEANKRFLEQRLTKGKRKKVMRWFVKK